MKVIKSMLIEQIHEVIARMEPFDNELSESDKAILKEFKNCESVLRGDIYCEQN